MKGDRGYSDLLWAIFGNLPTRESSCYALRALFIALMSWIPQNFRLLAHGWSSVASGTITRSSTKNYSRIFSGYRGIAYLSTTTMWNPITLPLRGASLCIRHRMGSGRTSRAWILDQYAEKTSAVKHLSHKIVDSLPHGALAWRIVTTERVVMVIVEWLLQIYAQYKIRWHTKYVLRSSTSWMARVGDQREVAQKEEMWVLEMSGRSTRSRQPVVFI